MCYFWKNHILFVFLFCLIFLCAYVIVVLWCKITAHCEYFRVGGDLSQGAAACPTKHFSDQASSGLPRWHSGKESSCQCRKCKRRVFNPWVKKIPLEEGMATHSSISCLKIPYAEEPGGLQSVGSQSCT